MGIGGLMQITYKKLVQMIGITPNTLWVYMSSYRLAKYQQTKWEKTKAKIVRIRVIEFNKDFINDFCEYLKVKQRDVNSFKWKANQLLRKAGKCTN